MVLLLLTNSIENQYILHKLSNKDKLTNKDNSLMNLYFHVVKKRE